VTPYRRIVDVELPTRVVHIQRTNSSTHPQRWLRLVHTNGGLRRYTTLSYCWGATETFYVATMKTLDPYLNSISWDWLPPLFQAGALVTLYLGYPYICINGLCIVQDDPDDWRGEVNNMTTIYFKSVITLAAAQGSDPTEGLYSKLSSQHVAKVFPIEAGEMYLRGKCTILASLLPVMKNVYVFLCST
jgi:hypothetical protein